MDNNANNPFNPHNSQNRQSDGAMSHILQNGVTPEQYAQNARQLEAYSRMNALGLQVYLQRQNHVAEQRRQDESRLIQLAQQLATGSQQPQRQQQQFLPAVPQVPRGHQPPPAQQPNASSSRNATLQMYNHGRSHNTSDVMSQNVRHPPHVMEPSRVPVSSVQQQQHYSSFNASTPHVNQTFHPQRDTSHIRPIGGVGAVATQPLSTYPQAVQPPKPTPPASMQHQFRYLQYPGVSITGPQTRAGQGSTSSVNPNQGILPNQQVNALYHSWVQMHGPEKAAAMTKDLMQSWQQKRQIHQEQASMHSATASSTAFASTGQSQISNHNALQGVSAAPQPHFRRQEWTSAPAISGDERLVPSQHHPVTPLHSHTDNSAPQATVSQGIVSPQEFPISDVSKEEKPVHSATTTNFASTFPTAPSSQSHSILLAPEEKSTALYTMRGLAASIKRSLNAERMAASGQPTATLETHVKTEKQSPSEAVDDVEQSGPATAGTASAIILADTVETVPVLPLDGGENPPLPTVPSLPQVSASQQETGSPPDEVTIPNLYQEPPSNHFVPFSTLAGAVSFDNAIGYAPVDRTTIPSRVASPIDVLMNLEPEPDVEPHDHMDVPLLSFAEASFNGLSFPTRTPTPPLAATITPLRDDDGANADETPSSTPTSPRLDQVEIQSESISPASEGGLEAKVVSASDICENQDQIHFNVTSLSSEHANRPEAQIRNSPKEEPRIFVRRTGLLDSSIEEISGELWENVRIEGYPVAETDKLVRTSEVPSAAHTPTWPTSGRSSSPAATSGPGVFPKPPVNSAGRPTFYIAVPPRPEWVRRVKRREAANKRLASEETGQRSDREYAENELANRLCPRLCHWVGCQAVLNSMYTLKQHVRRHQSEVEPVGPAMTVSCQWKQCRMVCEQFSLLSHLNRHIEKEITCLYDDCDERFSRVQDFVAHERSEHANDEPLLCAIPQRPVPKAPVPLPQTLPSYTVTTRPASKPSVSAERHARLGPWVLGMTFGHPVTGSHGDTRLTDKALKVVPTPILPSDGNGEEMAPKFEFVEQLAEYDLLEEPSIGSTRFFDDLNTAYTTRVFRDGVSVESKVEIDSSCAPKGVASDGEEGQGSLQMVVDSDSMAVEALL